MAATWKWIAGTVAFVGVISLGVALEDKPGPREPEAITRAAFLDGCRVDSQIEACTLGVGKPDTTQASTDGRETWYYKRRTLDPVTQRRDSMAQVVVVHGVVRQINFQ